MEPTKLASDIIRNTVSLSSFNKYKMPFALQTGVRHNHMQNINTPLPCISHMEKAIVLYRFIHLSFKHYRAKIIFNVIFINFITICSMQ